MLNNFINKPSCQLFLSNIFFFTKILTDFDLYLHTNFTAQSHFFQGAVKDSLGSNNFGDYMGEGMGERERERERESRERERDKT